MERTYDYLNVKKKLESVYMVGKSIESDIISANNIYSENIKMTNINIDNYDVDNLYADNVNVNVLNSKGVLNLFDNTFPQNTIDTTSISSLGAGEKWFGGVLAPNGKIYCVPFNSTSVLVINPTDNTVDNIGSLAGNEKWSGGVLALNGKIYCVPASSTSVLIIDPLTDSLDTTTITGLSGSLKWRGGVLAPNGKIYCIPYGATNVLIINPLNNSIDITSISGLSGGINKWNGGVLAPNGKIYCVPYSNDNILIIDPNNNTYDNNTLKGFSGVNKWSGGALGPDGKIYCAPSSSSRLLIIDDPLSPIQSIVFTGTPIYDNSLRKLTCTGSSFLTTITFGDNIIITNLLGDTFIGYVEEVQNDFELIFWLSLGTTVGTIVNLQKTNKVNVSTRIPTLSPSTKCNGIVLSDDNKLYILPYDSTVLPIIDPYSPIGAISFTGTPTYNNTQKRLTCTGSNFLTNIFVGDNIILSISTGNKFIGYVQSITDNFNLVFVYALGSLGGTIINIQKNRFIDLTTMTGITSNNKYAGGILAPNGKIYGIPYSSTNSIIINPSLPTLNNWMINPYFNKF